MDGQGDAGGMIERGNISDASEMVPGWYAWAAAGCSRSLALCVPAPRTVIAPADRVRRGELGGGVA